jgi:hypothetical protein
MKMKKKPKPKQKRAPGGGRKPIHSPDAKLVQIRLPPDVLAWIADSGLTQQDAVVQAVRHSPEYRIWHGEQ